MAGPALKDLSAADRDNLTENASLLGPAAFHVADGNPLPGLQSINADIQIFTVPSGYYQFRDAVVREVVDAYYYIGPAVRERCAVD